MIDLDQHWLSVFKRTRMLSPSTDEQFASFERLRAAGLVVALTGVLVGCYRLADDREIARSA